MISGMLTISLDVMSGDNSPAAELGGLEMFLRENSADGIRFLLYGRGLEELINSYPKAKMASRIFEAQEVILASDKLSTALRRKRNSSLHMAIASVKSGESDAIISSGNTAALMAISRLELRTLPGIHRPAIIAVLPSLSGNYSLLDLGANVNSDADSLVQFAIMGRAFSRIVFKKENPSIALLNIGEEETKGTDSIREAHNILTNFTSGMNFVGYIESDKLFDGKVDVVVADGFCGNVFLKAVEGTAKFMKKAIRESVSESWKTKLLAPFVRSFLKSTMNRFDPRNRNGGMLLGLNGIVIKSHGSADAMAFCSAIGVAIDIAKNNINDQIIEEISTFSGNTKL